jgi:anti-sigma regulatory factor (Ser/Thr protein kinase)
VVLVSLPKPEWPHAKFEAEVERCAAAGAEIVRISVGDGKLHVPGLDRLLDDTRLGRICAALRCEPVHLVIDLCGCRFLDPYGLTAVRALCEHVAPRVQRIWLCLPFNLDTRMYFGVSGLTDSLRGTVTIVDEPPGGVRPSTGSDVLLPLMVISDEESVEAVHATARERLDDMLDRLGWPKAIAVRTRRAILETALNVLDHSERIGYVAVQGYSLDRANGFVVAAISDAGVGIRETLARAHPSLRDEMVHDGEVLRRLFDDRMTSRVGHSGGLGMRTLQDAVETMGGQLGVSSGRGRYHQSGRNARQKIGAFVPGTHIRFSLNRLQRVRR